MARQWGMPYKGSKNRIAEKIIDFLPGGERLYDLFGGGGAITHCAVMSGKWKHVVYNEPDPVVYKGFCMAIHGEFKNETRWISREDFYRLKDTDPYVAICFSFGNDLRTYCYSRENENLKRILHKAIVFHDFEELEKIVGKMDHSLRGRKEITAEVKKRVRQGHLQNQHLEAARRLDMEVLERLQSFERLQSLDYQQVTLAQNSILYCDIPYKGTNNYRMQFDYDRFYKWAEQQDNIFISEYAMPDNFIEVWSCQRQASMDAKGKNSKAQERIFTNQKTYEKLKETWLI